MEHDALIQFADRLFQNSMDHISIIGRDYRYQLVNTSYEKHHGSPRSKLIGKHVKDLLGERTFISKVKPCLDRCLEGETVDYQAWFTFKNTGRRFMFVRYFPLSQSNGEIDRVAVVSRDITDMEMLETKLQTIQELVKSKEHSTVSSQAWAVQELEEKPRDRAWDLMNILSLRERRILSRIAQGQTNKEIGVALDLSEKTVRNLLSHLFKKLQVTRRTEAVALFSKTSPPSAT